MTTTLLLERNKLSCLFLKWARGGFYLLFLFTPVYCSSASAADLMPKKGKQAVDVQVHGKVTDEKGEPLIGVTIRVQGGNAGTVTDPKGEYSISLPENASLVFSYIGYTPQTVPVSGTNIINIVLRANNNLSEVVVTGYTTQSKHKLTSAIVSVTGDELTKRVATDPTSLLQGQLPGLSVVQNSAEPGNESIQLRIRGLSTFNGNSDPLIIVDGLPGSLTAINPNDIESVTELKDAAAAAIYGSRGANGVIVVKTKKGKAGTLSITYSYNVGFSTPTRLPKLITNSADYMTLLNEADANSSVPATYTQDQIDLYRNATDREKYPNHDWLKDMFSTAVQQNHYLNLTGGTDKTTYHIGLGYTDQPGTMKGFDYQKYTLALGLETKVSKRITFGTDLQFRYGNRVYPYDNATDLYISTLAQTPLYPAQAPDGKWITKAYPLEQSNKNPVLTSQVQAHTPDYYGQGNVSLNVDLGKGLKWENRFGVNFDYNNTKYFSPTIPVYLWSDMSYVMPLNLGNPGVTENSNVETHTTVYSQLNYTKAFGKHSLTLLGGVQQEADNYNYLNGYRTGYPTNLLSELDAGSTTGQTVSGSSSQWAVQSAYGSVNYDFDDKYLLGANVRYDGSSRLPSAHRWKLYESISGAWRISKENFLKDVSWLNDLKLRGSWGKLGNQNALSNYPYQLTLSQSSYAFAGTPANGFAQRNLVDPNLTWETTREVDAGLDLTVLNNKLTITADWFNKYTYDILRPSQVPQWLGVNSPVVNNGAVRNKGVEFSASYKDRINKDLTYFISGNIQAYRNKVEAFGAPVVGGPDGQTIMQNGYPINSFYLYTMDGIFQNQSEINKAPDQSSLGGVPTPGDIRYKDINGDGKVDANDRSIVDGQYPKFQYSYSMGVNWKNFDASVQLYGSYGNKVYLYKWGVDPFAQGAPPTVDWLNRWTPTNPSTTMPKIYLGFYGYPKITNVQSTFHLYDASYMRIKNVQVGYTFHENVIKGVKSIRIYGSVDNLALFTPLKQPADPERLDLNFKPDAWYGFANYPQNRTFTFGASVQF